MFGECLISNTVFSQQISLCNDISSYVIVLDLKTSDNSGTPGSIICASSTFMCYFRYWMRHRILFIFTGMTSRAIKDYCFFAFFLVWFI